MDWFPTVFITFKILMLGTGMFFAIKWHFDQGKKGAATDRRAVLRTGGKVAAVFVLLLVALLSLTFGLGSMLGLDLHFP